MCRLLGITHFDYNRHQELLRHFFQLAETGNILPGDPPGHADGWGAGYYREGKAFLHRSGGSLTDEENTFFTLMKEVSSSDVLILHLRKSAWPETATADNAHPFMIGNRLFAHNGTIRDYQGLTANLPPEGKPRDGALDSEVFFHFILGFGADIGNGLRKAAAFVRAHHTYSALNCLLTDGIHLYAYRDFVRHPAYYSLYHAEQCGTHVVSSEPLTSGIDWKMMDKRRCHAW